MGRGTGIQSFPAEDLRKRTRYLKFPLVVVLRTFLSQKRLFCIDPRGRAVDRRRSGDSPKRAGSKGKGKRKERKKRKEKKERRNKSPFNDFFFVLLKARARIDCAIKTRTGLSRRSKSSRRIVLGSASANSLGPSTRYLGPPPLPLDGLARGRKTATDHRNWFVKVGSQRLYTLTVTKVTGTVSTYFGAGIDVASISSRARGISRCLVSILGE